MLVLLVLSLLVLFCVRRFGVESLWRYVLGCRVQSLVWVSYVCIIFLKYQGMWLKHVATGSVGTGCIPLLLPGFCQVSLVLLGWLLQKWLETLCYQYVDVGHMIQDCAQTVLHMLRCVPLVCLVGLVIHGQIIAELCELVGCHSQLLY